MFLKPSFVKQFYRLQNTICRSVSVNIMWQLSFTNAVMNLKIL